MLLLGCKPPGRHTEQHDVFFGIAFALNELVPEIQAFWPEPDKIHIDAWREVNFVDNFRVCIISKETSGMSNTEPQPKLFFINLGGYQEDKVAEQHYILLTVKQDKATACKEAKETLFFRHNHFEGANSHIDDKYGIDVDDFYEIEDIINPNYTVIAESVDKGVVKYKNDKMDIYGKEGTNAGKHFTAIYKYENKQLTICYNLLGNSYPEAFETKGKPLLFLSIFEREMIK